MNLLLNTDRILSVLLSVCITSKFEAQMPRSVGRFNIYGDKGLFGAILFNMVCMPVEQHSMV